MKTILKTCCLVLSMVMLLGLIPASAEGQKVVVSTMTFNNIPEDFGRVNQVINDYIEKTYPELDVAISLQLFGLPDFFEKIPLALSSGTQMDVFLTVSLASDVARGMLYPLDDLLDQHGQNLQAIMAKDFGEGAFDCTTFKGNIYAVPVNKAVAIPMMILYDEDYLAELGYTADDINTLDDIEKIMDDCLAKLPNVTPFHPINQGNTCMLLWLLQEYQIDRLGDSSFTGPFSGVAMGDSSQVINFYETDAFKSGMTKMHEWYLKGYIQKDAATTQAIASEYFSAKRCLFSLGGYSSESAATAISAQTGSKIGMKQISQYYMDTSAISVVMGIGSTTKVPEASMKMLDLIYTDPFIMNTILFGVEGEDYINTDGIYWSYPEGKDANSVAYTAALCSGVIGSESIQLIALGGDSESVQKALANNVSSNRSPFFGFVFDPSRVKNEVAAVTAVNDQYIKGLECGSLDPETAIAEFNNALYAAGLQTIIDEKQAQLDAWLANK